MKNLLLACAVLALLIASGFFVYGGAPTRAVAPQTQNAASTIKVLTKEQRLAAEQMMEAAATNVQQIEELEQIRAFSPEFIATRLDWMRRHRDAKILLAADKAGQIAAVDAYLTKCREIEKAYAAWSDEGPRYRLPPMRYAIAEGEFLKASLQ